MFNVKATGIAYLARGVPPGEFIAQAWNNICMRDFASFISQQNFKKKQLVFGPPTHCGTNCLLLQPRSVSNIIFSVDG